MRYFSRGICHWYSSAYGTDYYFDLTIFVLFMQTFDCNGDGIVSSEDFSNILSVSRLACAQQSHPPGKRKSPSRGCGHGVKDLPTLDETQGDSTGTTYSFGTSQSARSIPMLIKYLVCSLLFVINLLFVLLIGC